MNASSVPGDRTNGGGRDRPPGPDVTAHPDRLVTVVQDAMAAAELRLTARLWVLIERLDDLDARLQRLELSLVENAPERAASPERR